MAWYDNIDRRGYGTTQAWPEYNENFGQSFAGVGRFDPRNLMLPDNLSRDLGASTYQAPPPSQLNTLDPNWQHQLRMQNIDRGNIDSKWYDRITGPVVGGLKWLGEKFKRPEAKQRFYEEIMQGRSIEPWQTGTYKGNQYGLYNSPSGLKVSSDVIGWGEGFEKNLDSAFGSKSIEEMEQKKLDWAMNRISKGKAISQRLRDVLTARGLIGGDQTPDRTITDTTVTGTTLPGTGGEPSRPAYTGPKTFSFDPGLDRAMGGQRATKSGGFTDPGKGSYGPHRADGGRIGYNRGRVVNPGGYAGEIEFDENIEGPDYDENILEIMKGQGIPFGEQVEGEGDILSILVAKYIEAGFPPDQAQDMAMQELQAMAPSSQDQGIASLV